MAVVRYRQPSVKSTSVSSSGFETTSLASPRGVSEEVRLARIDKAREVSLAKWELARTVANSPLIQALAVWIVVEALQRRGFGEITGTILEGASVIKLFNIERTTQDIAALAKAFGPIIAPTALSVVPK